MMNRDDAWNLLCEFTRTESLRKHALAVEAAMRACAQKEGADAELWGMTGLLHDFDYEQNPEVPGHPMEGQRILAERGWPEDLRRAILAHVPAMGVPRDTPLARALFACDELCGFVVACAMVRPNRLEDLEASSVKKKMKDRAFARGVSREDIQLGASELGVPLEEHITFLIGALRGAAGPLGLAPAPKGEGPIGPEGGPPGGP
jgi:putative nucleotidyltransferase with HDIG domain